MPQVADPIPLALQLSAGESNKYVRASVYAPNGVEIADSPVALAHVATGLYQTDSLPMPDELYVLVQYKVYTDAGFTTLDTNYGIVNETFEKTSLAVAPAADIVADITGTVNDEDKILGEI